METIGFFKSGYIIGTLGQAINTNGVSRPNVSQCPVASTPSRMRALIYYLLQFSLFLTHARYAGVWSHWDIGTIGTGIANE